MLATIFGWPKEATLDRKLNARWLIDQSGVKDENMTMTFTDKGRLSNYARLRFSNEGLRDRSSLPWSNSVAMLASAIQKTRKAVWNLAPGCARRHQGMILEEKNRGNFDKNDVQRSHFLWVWSCKILYNKSNNHISFQCSTRQTACDWHPTDGMRRPCGMVKSCHEFGGSWVKIQQRHELFSSICWCFFYWNRSLSRCTQSIKTIQHSWQVMDWKQKDVNWDWQR